MKASLQEPLSLNISGGIPAYRIQWYFPSGEQYSGNNITHAFSNAGPDTIETQVTDSTGYVDTQNFTVNVHLYVAIAANQTTGLGPLSVQFSSSVLGGTDYAYNWSFSPGHYSFQQNPVYTFPAGNYTVQFTVTSANGATGTESLKIQSLPPPATFLYSPSVNDTILSTFHFTAVPNWDAGSNYTISWSFPNGQNLNGLNVSYVFPVYHEFNTVIATFTYANGQSYTQDLSVRLYPAPIVASFTVPSIVPEDTLLNVTATVKDPDSTSITYTWTFGNQTFAGPNQFFYFGSAGNYTITLTAVDGLGATDTVTKTIESRAVSSNPNIVIDVSKVTSGPYYHYSIHVLSSASIDIVEAFIQSQSLQPTLVNTTDGYWYNLTLDQQNYAPGTYPLKIVVFTVNGQSNYAIENFFVSQTYGVGGQPFNLASFFGGTYQMIFAILSITVGVGTMLMWWSDKKSKNTEYINLNGSIIKAKKTKVSRFSFSRHAKGATNTVNTSSMPPSQSPGLPPSGSDTFTYTGNNNNGGIL